MRSPHLLILFALLAFLPAAANALSGGPDDFGYIWLNNDEPNCPTYDWQDTAGGSRLTDAVVDNGIASFDIAMDGGFHFYDRTYDSVQIHRTGVISFGDPNSMLPWYPDTELPISLPGTDDHAMLAWMYTEFDMTVATEVWAKNITVDNMDAVVIRYWSLLLEEDGAEIDLIDSQILLLENGDISIRYEVFGGDDPRPAYAWMVGTQNHDQSFLLNAGMNEIGDFLTDGRQIVFGRPSADVMLTGTVTNVNNDLPIGGALVDFGYTSTLTDAQGNYSLDVHSTTLNWVVSATDYSPEAGATEFQSGPQVMDVALSAPTVVVLDLAAPNSGGTEVMAALADFGVVADYFESFAPVWVTDYDIAFILTGDGTNGYEILPGSPEEGTLIDFLNQGGSLYLDGTPPFTGPVRPNNLLAMLDMDVPTDNMSTEDWFYGPSGLFYGYDLASPEIDVAQLAPLGTSAMFLRSYNSGLPAGIINGHSGFKFAAVAAPVGHFTPYFNGGWSISNLLYDIQAYWDDPSTLAYFSSQLFDLDVNTGPFIPEGEDSAWEFGAPSGNGPANAHSGTNVWATNLEGAYPVDEDSRLFGVHKLPDLGANPQVRYWHWFDYGEDDGYQVVFTIDDGQNWFMAFPINGYGGGYSEEFSAPCFNNTSTDPGQGQWSQVTLDFSQYIASNITIAFRHMSSGAGGGHYGVAIDDIEFIGDAQVTVGGTVTHAITGEPIEGALIEIQLEDETVTSDENGQWSHILENGAGQREVTVSRDHFASVSETLEILDDVTFDTALQPTATTSLSGTVQLAPQGVPVEGATVSVGDVTGTTNEIGEFALTGLYDYWDELTVDHPGFEAFAVDLDLVPGENSVVVNATAPPIFVDISLVSGGDVPPGGGPVVYDLYVANNTGGIQQGDVWMMAILPNGSPFGPVWALDDFYFLPGFAFGNDMVLDVPAMAPAGDYEAVVYVGNRPNYVAAEDGIAFSKTAAATVASGELTGRPSGAAPRFEQVTVASGDDVGTTSLPDAFELGAAYPNPFNPTTRVPVALPEAAELTVTVYNIVGQQVAQLASGTYEAGHHMLTFDGHALAGGMYFVHATVPGQLNALQKVMLVR